MKTTNRWGLKGSDLQGKTSKLDRKFFEREPEIVVKELLGKFLVRRIGKSIYVGMIVETEAYLGLSDKASHSYRGETRRNKIMFGPAGHAYVYFTYGMHWLLNFVTEKEGKPSAVLIRAVEPIAINNNKKLTINTIDLRRLGSGPARLTKWMKIDGKLNGVDITEGTTKKQNPPLCAIAQSGEGGMNITKTDVIDTMNNQSPLGAAALSGDKVLFVASEIKTGGEIYKADKIKKSEIVSAKRIGVNYAGEHKNLPLRFYIKDNIYISKK